MSSSLSSGQVAHSGSGIEWGFLSVPRRLALVGIRETKQRGFVRSSCRAFQVHYDVFGLPRNATRVLSNAFNPNQAYVIDDRHIGFQCHVEMTRDLVETWCRTGADELPEASQPARQSRDDILRDIDAKVATLQGVADGIYSRWAQSLRP